MHDYAREQERLSLLCKNEIIASPKGEAISMFKVTLWLGHYYDALAAMSPDRKLADQTQLNELSGRFLVSSITGW
uniref:Uncharacterized protein n=1 Tax=Hyaloperonospora arabidopsidis (strain Emoy2) TaxID=559515 RepID=M4B1B3_HYAAE